MLIALITQLSALIKHKNLLIPLTTPFQDTHNSENITLPKLNPPDSK